MTWEFAFALARWDARNYRCKQYVYGVRLANGRWVYGVSPRRPW